MTTHLSKATKPAARQSPISPQAVIKQTEILKEEVAQLKRLIDRRERPRDTPDKSKP
jgi:hypothetical protein